MQKRVCALVAPVSQTVWAKTKSLSRRLVFKPMRSAPGSQKHKKKNQTPKPSVSLEESLTIKYFGGLLFGAFPVAANTMIMTNPTVSSVSQLFNSGSQKHKKTLNWLLFGRLCLSPTTVFAIPYVVFVCFCEYPSEEHFQPTVALWTLNWLDWNDWNRVCIFMVSLFCSALLCSALAELWTLNWLNWTDWNRVCIRAFL